MEREIEKLTVTTGPNVHPVFQTNIQLFKKLRDIRIEHCKGYDDFCPNTSLAHTVDTTSLGVQQIVGIGAPIIKFLNLLNAIRAVPELSLRLFAPEQMLSLNRFCRNLLPTLDLLSSIALTSTKPMSTDLRQFCQDHVLIEIPLSMKALALAKAISPDFLGYMTDEIRAQFSSLASASAAPATPESVEFAASDRRDHLQGISYEPRQFYVIQWEYASAEQLKPVLNLLKYLQPMLRPYIEFLLDYLEDLKDEPVYIHYPGTTVDDLANRFSANFFPKAQRVGSSFLLHYFINATNYLGLGTINLFEAVGFAPCDEARFDRYMQPTDDLESILITIFWGWGGLNRSLGGFLDNRVATLDSLQFIKDVQSLPFPEPSLEPSPLPFLQPSALPFLELPIPSRIRSKPLSTPTLLSLPTPYNIASIIPGTTVALQTRSVGISIENRITNVKNVILDNISGWYRINPQEKRIATEAYETRLVKHWEALKHNPHGRVTSVHFRKDVPIYSLVTGAIFGEMAAGWSSWSSTSAMAHVEGIRPESLTALTSEAITRMFNGPFFDLWFITASHVNLWCALVCVERIMLTVEPVVTILCAAKVSIPFGTEFWLRSTDAQITQLVVDGQLIETMDILLEAGIDYRVTRLEVMWDFFMDIHLHYAEWDDAQMSHYLSHLGKLLIFPYGREPEQNTIGFTVFDTGLSKYFTEIGAVLNRLNLLLRTKIRLLERYIDSLSSLETTFNYLSDIVTTFNAFCERNGLNSQIDTEVNTLVEHVKFKSTLVGLTSSRTALIRASQVGESGTFGEIRSLTGSIRAHR